MHSSLLSHSTFFCRLSNSCIACGRIIISDLSLWQDFTRYLPGIHCPGPQDEVLVSLHHRSGRIRLHLRLRFLLWASFRGRSWAKCPPHAARGRRFTSRTQSTFRMGSNQLSRNCRSFKETKITVLKTQLMLKRLILMAGWRVTWRSRTMVLIGVISSHFQGVWSRELEMLVSIFLSLTQVCFLNLNLMLNTSWCIARWPPWWQWFEWCNTVERRDIESHLWINWLWSTDHWYTLESISRSEATI